MSQALSISQVVSTIKKSLESHPALSDIECVGEISNFYKASSGHWYFSLKDSKAKIDCVMFASNTLKVATKIQEGDEVIVKGYVSVYAASGKVQIVVSQLSLDGQGALYQKYLQLRDILHKKGYFNQEHKKEIPKYPMKIGVIVGGNSAAQADIQKTLASRWPSAKVLMYESLVQGALAPSQLISRLKEADQAQLDVILLARGGGSLEDLWAFNDLELVMTIYEAKTPIITGVGHEIDVTLVDYVADKRGLTPTDAAVIATPNQKEVRNEINLRLNQLNRFVLDKINSKRLEVNHLVKQSVLNRPNALIVDKDYQLRQNIQQLNQFLHHYQNLSYRFDKTQSKLFEQTRSIIYKGHQVLSSLTHQMKRQIDNKQTRFDRKHSLIQKDLLNRKPINKLNQSSSNIYDLRNELISVINKKIDKAQNKQVLSHQELTLKSPYRLLEKGYIISYQNDRLIRSVSDININQPIKLVYQDGHVQVKVKEQV